MRKTPYKSDGTFAVLVVKYWSAPKRGIIDTIDSWSWAGGREEFDHALENQMIELDPKWHARGLDRYRPTKKGMALLQDAEPKKVYA